MNRPISLIIRTILIAAAALWAAFAMVNEYYFIFFLLMIFIASLAVSIILSERRIVRRVKYMMSCIRNGDLSVSFPPDTPGLYGELNRITNQALSAFRTRVYESATSEAEAEAWQKLIRVLGHEIMNSLAPIVSLSETMTDRGESQEPDRREYMLMLEAMKSIHRRSTGLLHFVENYRKLTRIPDPIKRFFTIADLFSGIKNLLGDDYPSIGFAIDPPSARLYADRSQIEQVILNIIKNSIEAVENIADLEIWIDAAGSDETVTVRIGDNGPGISAEGLDKVFVPFYTTKQTGSGIGLSVSRQIMNLHGGTITAESPAAGGALFTLIFNAP